MERQRVAGPLAQRKRVQKSTNVKNKFDITVIQWIQEWKNIVLVLKELI